MMQKRTFSREIVQNTGKNILHSSESRGYFCKSFLLICHCETRGRGVYFGISTGMFRTNHPYARQRKERLSNGTGKHYLERLVFDWRRVGLLHAKRLCHGGVRLYPGQERRQHPDEKPDGLLYWHSNVRSYWIQFLIR